MIVAKSLRAVIEAQSLLLLVNKVVLGRGQPLMGLEIGGWHIHDGGWYNKCHLMEDVCMSSRCLYMAKRHNVIFIKTCPDYCLH